MGEYLALRRSHDICFHLIRRLCGQNDFYNHFHTTYNHILRLAEKAEKHNLLDIFFHQDHGVLILLALIPYMAGCFFTVSFFLNLPSLPYPPFLSGPIYYLFNTLLFLVLILGFYWFRYGGTLSHDDKPEWDTIPSIVKKDTFFAKATVDDLVALEQVKSINSMKPIHIRTKKI